jgi:hypothetical protein
MVEKIETGDWRLEAGGKTEERDLSALVQNNICDHEIIPDRKGRNPHSSNHKPDLRDSDRSPM